MKSTSSEIYKDPRWQKKRLEILERDKFTCAECGSTDETLHVHHLMYGNEPWLVPSYALITLCESCHQDQNDCEMMMARKSVPILNSSMILFRTLRECYGFNSSDILEFAYALCLAAGVDKRAAIGAIIAVGISSDELNTSQRKRLHQLLDRVS